MTKQFAPHEAFVHTRKVFELLWEPPACRKCTHVVDFVRHFGDINVEKATGPVVSVSETLRRNDLTKLQQNAKNVKSTKMLLSVLSFSSNSEAVAQFQ